MERIAVIGSGIAGLSAARELTRASGRRSVTLFEAQAHFGGHANTVDVTLDGVSHGVDTGFLVYNERTYPKLIRLFAETRRRNGALGHVVFGSGAQSRRSNGAEATWPACSRSAATCCGPPSGAC